MPIYIPPLTYQQIADAAAQCLAENNKESVIPVPVEDIIDVGFGIDLVPTASLEERFTAIAFITHDLKEIRVDDFVYRKQPYRLRFSLAHELGHLVLHPHIYEQMMFKTPIDWKRAMEDLGRANYDRLEGQADRFAGLLLCPPGPFRAQFERVADALAQSGKTFKSLPTESQNYAVKGLARAFDVSSGAIWYRLRDEQLI
jgi:hypothetical protein